LNKWGIVGNKLFKTNKMVIGIKMGKELKIYIYNEPCGRMVHWSMRPHGYIPGLNVPVYFIPCGCMGLYHAAAWYNFLAVILAVFSRLVFELGVFSFIFWHYFVHLIIAYI
jgi:hypothetical protein